MSGPRTAAFGGTTGVDGALTILRQVDSSVRRGDWVHPMLRGSSGVAGTGIMENAQQDLRRLASQAPQLTPAIRSIQNLLDKITPTGAATTSMVTALTSAKASTDQIGQDIGRVRDQVPVSRSGSSADALQSHLSRVGTQTEGMTLASGTLAAAAETSSRVTGAAQRAAATTTSIIARTTARDLQAAQGMPGAMQPATARAIANLRALQGHLADIAGASVESKANLTRTLASVPPALDALYSDQNKGQKPKYDPGDGGMGVGGGGPGGRVGGGKAPEYHSGQVGEGRVLDHVERYLGPGAHDVGGGRYRSVDGQRQVRYGNHETNSKYHHIHFERTTEDGTVIENSNVRIVK